MTAEEKLNMMLRILQPRLKELATAIDEIKEKKEKIRFTDEYSSLKSEIQKTTENVEQMHNNLNRKNNIEGLIPSMTALIQQVDSLKLRMETIITKSNLKNIVKEGGVRNYVSQN